jgi:hypothetical protein
MSRMSKKLLPNMTMDTMMLTGRGFLAIHALLQLNTTRLAKPGLTGKICKRLEQEAGSGCAIWWTCKGTAVSEAASK